MAKKKGKSQHKPQKKFSQREYLRTKMRSLPIGRCYLGPVSPGESEVTVFVTREHPAGTVSVGIYLIDKYCCGVKDALYHFSISKDQVQSLITDFDTRIGLKEIPYVEAHNLIYGAMAYAEDIGIPPHDDFNDAQYILAEDNDDIPLIEYEFGKDGKPLLICHSYAEIEYYKRMMLKVIGPDEFETLLINQPSPDNYWEDDHEEDDIYEDHDQPYSVMLHTSEDGQPIPMKAFGPLDIDISLDIKKLDTVRKVAYFMMMLGLAKCFKDYADILSQFVEVAGSALLRYRKYGDVAFGEAAECLHTAITDIYAILMSPLASEAENDNTYVKLSFCLAYSYGLHRINLEQSDLLAKIIADAEHGEEMILDIFRDELDHTIAAFEKTVASAGSDKGGAKITFRVAGLKHLPTTWSQRTVHTCVRRPNYGFISKDPTNYYKRKVREAIDTPFASDEDFMGLVIIFYNMANYSIQMIQDNHMEQAYHVLSNILKETLWAVASHKFDQWISPGSDVRKSLSVVLANTTNILARMICCEFTSHADAASLYYECMRLKWTIIEGYKDLVDLHPIFYAFESTILSNIISAD